MPVDVTHRLALPVSSLLDSAIRKLYQYVDAQIADVRPFRAIVTGQSSGMVQLRRTYATSGETALRARCVGFDLATNDEVLCLPMADGLPVVVAKLQRATPSGAFTVPVALQVSGSSGATISSGSGSPEGVVTASVGSLYLRTNGSAGTIIYEKASGSGNTGWQANAATSSTPLIPVTYLAFSDTAVDNSSTSTWVDVVSRTVTLPTGTWTVEGAMWGRIAHDADPGNVDLRVVLDGTNGTNYTRSGPATGGWPGSAQSSKSSVSSGSRTFKGQMRANTSGTATMSNINLLISCTRTA